jgi:hypothetical protein
MSKLVLPVKTEYFDQIEAGTKADEYRLTTAYWSKRLEGRTYDSVEITHPHFGAEAVEVFAIHLTDTPS